MGRTWMIAISAMFLLLMVAWPQASQAAAWSFSTHRVLMAADQPSDQSSGESAAPVVPSGKKNIGKGVMFSLIIPGAGQLYSGSWIRAVPWFAVEVAGWAFFAKYHGQGKDKNTEFETYAGPRRLGFDQPQLGHFDVNAYMYREYQIATNPSLNSTPYNGTGLSQWETELWSTRSSYFDAVTGFTHDVMTDDMQQYYEMIGKYINQFGFGWEDTWDHSMVTRDANGIYRFDQLTITDEIWRISGDDPAAAEFDGRSAMFYHYRDMRGQSNDLLNKGNVAMEVVLVNHVLSALDAAFAVRRFNKHFEQSKLGDLKLHYDMKQVNGNFARVMTLSIPLD